MSNLCQECGENEATIHYGDLYHLCNRCNDLYLDDGEPCKHIGCQHHYSHPCEVCGRIAAQGQSWVRLANGKEKNDG